MISIVIRCKSCTFLVRGVTPNLDKEKNFDGAVRRANAHAETQLHELEIVGGRITRTD